MQRISEQPPRFSASQLPADVDPEEKDFVRLLARALEPSFVLVRRLGAGGMGAVYLARDPVLKRLVAVKVMAPALAADPAARQRFEREAQAVASISHPNVVAVHSVGELENGVPYLVMQYVEGRTMADRLKENGALDVHTARRVLGEVASALVAAHRKGIIHRDIKPANILWDDESGRVLVSDFGIAAVRELEGEQEASRITSSGMAIGTPAFMSPEQLLSEPITDRTDIYALGLLGYELLIGEGPYRVQSPHELTAAHLRDTPRPLSSMRPDVDPELERLLEACLAKEPTRRPSARDVERRLMHGASVLLEWPPPALEHLRGLLNAGLRVLSLGAFAIGVPVVALSVFDQESFLRQVLPPTVALVAIAGIGLLTFAAGLVRIARFVDAARKAVESGYAWGTILEVAADARGDTGALIAGGREYAELTVDGRSAMRRNRIAALACRVLAAVTPVLGYAVAVAMFGSRSSGPTIVLWFSLLLSLTLTAAAWMIWRQENRTMFPARQRMRVASARAAGMQSLAETWIASFEQVRVGQRLGAGWRGGGRVVRGLTSAGIALATIAAIGIVAALSVSALLAVYAENAIPSHVAIRSRLQRVQRLARYRVPEDSTISALRAGQALHALIRNGPGGRVLPFERTPEIAIPPQSTHPVLEDPFAADGGWSTAAFRQARRGFSVRQRDFLRQTAENTGLEEFRRFARAPRMDFADAYWDIVGDSTASMVRLPVPQYAPVRKVALANVAQAALDLAAGRPDSAERRLRENISAGFHLIEDGHLIIDNLVGAALVASARNSLQSFYEATGRPRDAQFVSPAVDPTPSSDLDLGERISIRNAAQITRRVILDSTEALGLRWEDLHSFTIESCADPHQLVFGPDSVHHATLTDARRQLVRTPTEAALFDLMVKPPLFRGRERRGGLVGRLMTAITGNPRFADCLSLLTGDT